MIRSTLTCLIEISINIPQKLNLIISTSAESISERFLTLPLPSLVCAYASNMLLTLHASKVQVSQQLTGGESGQNSAKRICKCSAQGWQHLYLSLAGRSLGGQSHTSVRKHEILKKVFIDFYLPTALMMRSCNNLKISVRLPSLSLEGAILLRKYSVKTCSACLSMALAFSVRPYSVASARSNSLSLF
ncbi:hypothetical protein FGO68_gene5226 [Halteria grandinella]|uniref:Uncharacterized protein n=1 Tax=Halteria grandinella TaxID=5974 RepID=A0A8J8NEG7_HALGN|nr:hypothetical protein FGO68_gene5226 [Halteria grandinella]